VTHPQSGAPPGGRAPRRPDPAAEPSATERALMRVTRLQALTAALSRAVTPAEVAQAVVREGRWALDAAATIVVIRDGDECEVVAAEGYPAEVLTVGARFPIGLATPLAGVVRTGRPVWMERPADGDAARIAARSGLPTGAALPLRVGGATIGAMGYRYRDETRPVPRSERTYLGTVAELCAQALERARLYEAERAARAAAQDARRAAERAAGRIERLQELTAALSESLTADEVAAVTVGQAADALDAEGGWLVLLDEDGAPAALLAHERCPAPLLRLLRRGRIAPAAPLADAVAAGEPRWLGRDELEARWPELAAADPAAGGLALLPIVAHGRTLGAAGLRLGAGAQEEEADRTYAHSLARLCAGALERALRYEREHEVAATLQRSLLPRGVPTLPGAEIAMRYVPVDDGVEVGGDWYESVELPDERIGLAVGDVVGRGVEAAAVMGQLRSAMRAFALDGGAPGTVLERLSRFAEGVEGARAATVVYAVVDPAAGELRYSCAGHPPPLLVAPGGDAAYLAGGRSLPLASGLGDGSFAEGRAELPPGTTLLLYSDGAIERRGESVDAGLSWLRGAVTLAGDIEPEALCAHLLERLGRERPPRDDVALVALRLAPRPAERLALRVPAHARRVSGLRREVLGWLERSGVEDDVVHDIVLACGEACANAVEHAYAGGAAGLVEVDVAWDGPSEIVLEVRDHGRWRPPRPDPGDRGRGLMIMRELMDAVEVEAGEEGTAVMMRRGISTAGPARLVLESIGGRTLARLRGELDASSAASIGARLQDELAGDGPELVVDLSGVVGLDRAGVRMIRELVRRSRAEGRPMVLLLPRGSSLRRGAEVTSLSAMAPVVASLEEARASRGLAGRATAGRSPRR
jgi:anti-anti-sigma factor